MSRKGIILAELDKTASVYMPREQNEIKPPVTELTDAYPEYGGNSLQRPLGAYEQLLGSWNG